MASALSSSSSSSHHMMCPALSSIPASFARIRFHSLRRVPPLPFPSRRSLPPRRKYPFSSTRAPSLSITSLAQGSHVKKVTAKELDAILDGKRDCPVVVDFYATWCGPCVLLSQELELLAAEYGESVKFLKVDTDEEHELASQIQIQGLPTLIFVSKDAKKNAIRTEGLLPADVIRNIIENEL